MCEHSEECDCLPGAILSAAVDVGPIIQQVLDDAEPAAGARLVEGAVAGVVSVVHLAHSVLQAVEDHLLQGADTQGGQRFSISSTGTHSVPIFPLTPLPQELQQEGLFALRVSGLICTLGLVSPLPVYQHAHECCITLELAPEHVEET